VVEAIRKLAIEADEIIIATDPDSEGEKIAYDVYLMVKPLVSKNKSIKRMELHEITFKAFREGIKNLKEINTNRVYAQILRRIGDRWVGFSISSILQKKLGKKTLGAGRVQTPVLNWIITRYEQYIEEKHRNLFIKTNKNITLRIIGINKEWDKKFINKVKKKIRKTKFIKIKKIKVKEEIIYPPRPLNTSDMLIKATNKFKITVEQVMKIAQDLFEAGLITYHRTDSHYISDLGFKIAQQYLEQKGLRHLFEKHSYDTRGAHECIRPTRALDRDELENLISTGQLNLPIQLTQLHYKLYDLIFQTFIASQMRSTKVIKKELEFEELKISKNIKLKIESFEGIIDYDKESFAMIIPIQINEKLVPLNEGDTLEVVNIRLITLRPKLFTEDEIVAEMKKENIGRPSTYATIINKLKEHGYVVSSKKKKSLIPTELANQVMGIINKKFEWLSSVELTRKFEEAMDDIEKGKVNEKGVMEKISEFFNEYYVKIKSSELNMLRRL